MNEPHYQLMIISSARWHLTEDLPEAVATAAFEFITGPVLEHPRRSGSSSDHPWQTGTVRGGAPTACCCTESTNRPER